MSLYLSSFYLNISKSEKSTLFLLIFVHFSIDNAIKNRYTKHMLTRTLQKVFCDVLFLFQHTRV